MLVPVLRVVRVVVAVLVVAVVVLMVMVVVVVVVMLVDVRVDVVMLVASVRRVAGTSGRLNRPAKHGGSETHSAMMDPRLIFASLAGFMSGACRNRFIPFAIKPPRLVMTILGSTTAGPRLCIAMPPVSTGPDAELELEVPAAGRAETVEPRTESATADRTRG